MNKYSYKNLNVYQDAKALVVDVYQLLKTFPVEERYALCDQIRRAVISITSNIAEGMNRISDKEKAHFLGFAYASMMEVDSQLDVAVVLGYITFEQYNIIEEKIDRIARQLSALRSKYKEESVKCIRWSVENNSSPLHYTPYALH